ncbi:MAG: trypsin-like peptidase domain-containing protein [Deltaproteobacteria bacterium]|nr:trypsin-like peptidase domain-containing protein [Deltaproteobacteria bacterium]
MLRGRRCAFLRSKMGGILLAAVLLVAAATSQAVVIASGDGSGNTSAPPDDPGFANLGVLNGLTGVYLGNGWVLSAWHVGEATFVIGGATYQPVPGSLTRPTGPGADPPDLMLMKIDGDPGLPTLPIASMSPQKGADVILVGNGRSRNQPMTYLGHAGWTTKTPFTMRWGTNEIGLTSQLMAGAIPAGPTETMSIGTAFDPPGTTPHEGQTVLGDSGGALFHRQGQTWRLAGTLYGSSTHLNQPDPQKTAVEGNLAIAADLAYYRTQILAITEVPGCNDGLDDDGDGLIDYPDDPGCSDANDMWERAPELICDDGVDNDGDGLVDHPDDPQCISPLYHTEAALVPAGAAWSGTVLAATISGAGFVRLCRCAAQSSRRTL